MRSLLLATLGWTLALPGLSTQAQTQSFSFSPAVTVGSPVAGLGDVTQIERLAINDHGAWLVEIDSDHADPTADGALLLDGAMAWREGQGLSAPAGAQIDSFGSQALDGRGASTLHLFLDGTSGNGDDSCITRDGALLLQEGDATGAAGLTPGTPWKGFFSVTPNDSRQLLVLATVDDPAITSSSDHVLARLQLSAGGALLSQELVVKEGDLLPGQVQAVSSLLTLPHSLAFNDAGEALFVAGIGSIFSEDQAVYLDDTLLAMEGMPSPVPGRDWMTLTTTRLDLNNCGQTVFSGTLDGDPATNAVLIKDGAVLAQSGTGLPAIGAFTLVDVGSGPVFMGENGQVLWYGRWDDPDTSQDEGLFLDDQLVVQEGVTTVGGVTVASLEWQSSGYALARFGERLMFRGTLSDGTIGAFVGGSGAWAGLGLGKPGSGGEVPCHTATGTLAGGAPLTLDLDRAPPGSTANLVYALAPLEAPFKGGTLVPFPELMLFGLALDGAGSLSVPAVMPPGLPGDVPIYTQFWVADPGATAGFSASNAVVGTTP